MRILTASIIVCIVMSSAMVVRAEDTTALAATEIAYDLVGSDDNREWVEFYNSSSQPIDLTGWKLRINQETTAHTLDFSSEKGARGGAIVAAGGYVVVADNASIFAQDYPSYEGMLVDSIVTLPNYSASRTVPVSIELTDAQGIRIVTDSYVPKQTIAAGHTIEKVEGVWQDSLVMGGNPGKAAAQLTSYPVTITISEIVSNPEGSDTDSEWVELENFGDQAIDLNGWYLVDQPTASGTTKKYVIPGGMLIGPGQRIVIALAGSMLNNTEETITLYSSSGTTVESVSVAGDAKEGWSYSRQGSVWSWTNLPTPGKANEIVTPTTPASATQPTGQKGSPTTTTVSPSSRPASVAPTATANLKLQTSPKPTPSSKSTSNTSGKSSPKSTKSPKTAKQVSPPSALSQIAGISTGPEPYRFSKRDTIVAIVLLTLVLLGSLAYRFRLYYWLMNRFRYGILKKNE
jgi:hypothetical protein